MWNAGLPMNRSLQSDAQNPAASPWVALAILVVFAIIMAVFGGSSRADAAQGVVLRPAAALMLIPALYLMQMEAMRAARIPLLLLVAFAFWLLLQLIPLPASIWQSLPDRDLIAELDNAAGLGDVWRPISLVPTRGLNALASLIVPAAAILLAIALRMSARDIFIAIAALGAVDAVLGILQLVTGAKGPLYFYAVTNRGSAVGLFANANHSAVFSSVVMMVSARLFLNGQWCRELLWLRVYSALTFLLGLMAVIVSSSRAGIVTGLAALACSVVLVYMQTSTSSGRAKTGFGRSRQQAKAGKRQAKPKSLLADPRKLATMGFVLVLALVALFVLNGRAAGLEDALNRDAFDDLRWELAPILLQMAGVHWFVGTGFGSFDEVYHIYEPSELLFSRYVNQAHNDWLQLIIEGGIPAICIVAALLIWIAKSVLRLLADKDNGRKTALFWSVTFGIFMAASVPDYPLRTPIFQVVAIWLIVALAQEAHARRIVKDARQAV